MKRILIIDDDRSIRETILELSATEGFQTYVAENGALGVQAAIQHQPDLILCDVVMPQLDGYGVLTTLRQSAENRHNSVHFPDFYGGAQQPAAWYGVGGRRLPDQAL
jgi:CheY-like chemotaxis protein